jgi:tetratricopeptide (TPR) repeat protein
MPNLVGSVLAFGLAFGPMSVLAQTPKASAPADLPRAADPPVHGVVPGVGPTPGVILEVDTPAAQCSRNATAAAEGRMTPGDAIGVCNEAILSGVTPPEQVAGVLVNRGVLLMTLNRSADALQDFDHVLATAPDHAEALVNRGAILLSEGKSREALADLDRGIALGPERPERAYFTRGMAREDLKDVRGAYADYKMAETLSPGWPPVVEELSRFKVVSK